MKLIEGLYYSEDHEWVKVKDNKAYVGITDFAQNKMGDIVFVELPEEGDEYDVQDSICTVESVKAASEIYTPIAGTIVEINTDLEDDPAVMNSEPYDSWLACVEMVDDSQLDVLMDKNEYEKYCAEEA